MCKKMPFSYTNKKKNSLPYVGGGKLPTPSPIGVGGGGGGGGAPPPQKKKKLEARNSGKIGGRIRAKFGRQFGQNVEEQK